jgi:hypothetical protein
MRRNGSLYPSFVLFIDINENDLKITETAQLLFKISYKMFVHLVYHYLNFLYMN